MDNENKGLDFDPTESEEFYDNLDKALHSENSSEDFDAEPTTFEEDDLPEIVLPEDTFLLNEEEELSEGNLDNTLSKQIVNEFEQNTELGSTEEKEPNKFVRIWREIPNWTKILVSVILVVLVSVGLLFGTAGGKRLIIKFAVNFIFDRVNVDEPPTTDPTISIEPSETGMPDITITVTPEPTEEPDITSEPLETPEPTATPTPAITIMDDKNIINVLLLGEENIYGAKRGRTDAIILVSINLNGGPLKMISFQRDLYVDIPGRASDKLNAAYAYGGATKIVETIENNFGVDIDSYVKVGFDGFENIIDSLGGLRLSLTARESEYLNTTRYISKPSERNTVAGYQTLTGSQVLGFCRVRYVPTENGLSNDRGRNYRHRMVLQAMFNQYKNKSLVELYSVMNQCLGYVTVPENLETLAVDCLSAVVEKQMFEIETMQIPQSNLYSNTTIAGADVVVFYPENVDRLQEFIYGAQ